MGEKLQNSDSLSNREAESATQTNPVAANGVFSLGTPVDPEAKAAGAPVSWVDPLSLAGVPDSFQRLWTPHRLAYLRGESRPADKHDKSICPFCVGPTHSDEDALIIHRGENAFVLCNLFPYNSGHLLVCPYRHVSDWTEINAAEIAEIGALVATAMRVIRQVSNPQGFNLGLNQGEVAGAGIAGHLHQHIVPRFRGDSNFFPIIGQTRSLPFLLSQTREILAEAWPQS